ncbi:hypothetical protein QQ73_09475, partial [Candidatus Endoriftia persephone str. Guaymas]|nr:hypothetical protein [Candidatus Endoriftia persephone str. Guaymas]
YQGKFILAKLSTEEQRELAAQYGIRSLPTVKLFCLGQDQVGLARDMAVEKGADLTLRRRAHELVQWLAVAEQL